MGFRWDGVLVFDEFGESQRLGPDKYGALISVRRRFVMTFEPGEDCTCTTDVRTCRRHRIFDHQFWLVDEYGQSISAPVTTEAHIRAMIRLRLANIVSVGEVVLGLISHVDSWR